MITSPPPALSSCHQVLLIRVSDEKSSTRERHGPFVDTAPPPQVLGVLDALLARQGCIQEAIARELRRADLAQLGQGIGLLGAAAASHALRAIQLVLPAGLEFRLVVLRCQAARPLRRVAGTPSLVATATAAAAAAPWGWADHAAGRAVRGRSGSAPARGAAAPAAAGAAVVEALHGDVVLVASVVVGRGLVIAVLALDLGGAEAQGHAADADVVVLGGVADDAGLAVVAYLGGDLAGAAADARGRAALRGAREDLLVGALLRGTLLGEQPRVFVLGPVAPHGRLLLPQQRHIAHTGATSAAGARGRAASDVGCRGGAERSGRRRRIVTGGGAEGVDRGRAAVVAAPGGEGRLL